MRTINAEQLHELIESDTPATVINVLSTESFAAQHIPGSHNIPLDDPNFEAMIEDLVDTRDARIIVYCANDECDASSRALRKLEAAGFTEVIDFEGGMESWSDHGFRVSSGATVRTRPGEAA